MVVRMKIKHFYDVILMHIYRDKADNSELTDTAEELFVMKKWKKNLWDKLTFINHNLHFYIIIIYPSNLTW